MRSLNPPRARPSPPRRGTPPLSCPSFLPSRRRRSPNTRASKARRRRPVKALRATRHRVHRYVANRRTFARSRGPPGRPTTMRRCATRSRIHRRGAGAARPSLHQPRPARVRPGQPARDRQGGAFCPLFAVFGDGAAALPGGVRRRRRRPARGPSTAPRASARGEALRARLPRLRRRLDRPGRRRPHRLRVGLQRADQGAAARPPRRLPRAVDPLHPLRQAAARGGAATATTATRSSGP